MVSKMTERLLQVAAIMAICWFGWLFLSNTVLHILRMQNTIQALTQKLEAGKIE